MTVKSFTYKTEDIKMTGLREGSESNASFDDQSVSIEIRGTDTSLDSLSSEDFTLSVDCSELKEGKNSVEVTVELSERAKQSEVTVSPVKVDITLQEES